MAKPVVTCGANQVLLYSSSSRTINLTATATESPTAFKWEMKSVPQGSSADSGVNGDFTDGVANVQNPSFDIDGGVFGGYVLECTAYNGEWSDPTSDREGAQTEIRVVSSRVGFEMSNDYSYNWGLSAINPILRKIDEQMVRVSSAVQHVYVDFDTGDDEKSGADWANAKATLANAVNSLPELLEHNVSIHCRGTSTENTALSFPEGIPQYVEIIVDGLDNFNNVTVVAAPVTATSATHTTVTVTGAGWTPDEFRGVGWVEILDGDDAGEIRAIRGNTSDTITFAQPIYWLSGTPQFRIIRASTVVDGGGYEVNMPENAPRLRWQGFDFINYAYLDVYYGSNHYLECVTFRNGSYPCHQYMDRVNSGSYYRDPDTFSYNFSVKVGASCLAEGWYCTNIYHTCYIKSFVGDYLNFNRSQQVYITDCSIKDSIVIEDCLKWSFSSSSGDGTEITGEQASGSGINIYGGHGSIYSTSISNKSDHAIILANCICESTSQVTGSGNSKFGLYIKDGAKLLDSLGMSVTGTLGDVTIDESTEAATWASINGGTPFINSGEGLLVRRSSDLAAGGGADADAIHDNVAGEIAAVTEKASPVSADLLLIEDSADSNNKKRVQVGNLPSLTRSSGEGHYYLDTTSGDDSNDGLTSGTPKLTWDGLYAILPDVFEHNTSIHVVGSGSTAFTAPKALSVAAGKQLIIDGGDGVDGETTYTADIHTVDSIGDSSQSWTPDQFEGRFLEILTGTYAGTRRMVRTNTATTIYFVDDLFGDPGTADFRIIRPQTVLNEDVKLYFQNSPGGHIHVQRLRIGYSDAFEIVGDGSGTIYLTQVQTSNDKLEISNFDTVYFDAFYYDPDTFIYNSTAKVGVSAQGSDGAIVKYVNYVRIEGSVCQVMDVRYVNRAAIWTLVCANALNLQHVDFTSISRYWNGSWGGVSAVTLDQASFVRVSELLQCNSASGYGIWVKAGPCFLSVTSPAAQITGTCGLYGMLIEDRFTMVYHGSATIDVTGPNGDITINGTAEDADWATITAGTPFTHAGANVLIRREGDDIPAGGSGSSPLTTKGDVYTFDTADARLPVGSDFQFLMADSNETSGLKWSKAVRQSVVVLHYYIDFSSGNDSNDGLTAGTAKLTWAGLYAILPDEFIHDTAIHLTGSTSTLFVAPKKLTVAAPVKLIIDGGDSVQQMLAPQTADGSGTNYISNSGASWSVNAYRGYWVEFTSGTYNGYQRLITHNDATTLYFGSDPTFNPGLCTFRVVRPATTFSGNWYFWFDSVVDSTIVFQRLYGTADLDIYGGNFVRLPALVMGSGTLHTEQIHTVYIDYIPSDPLTFSTIAIQYRIATSGRDSFEQIRGKYVDYFYVYLSIAQICTAQYCEKASFYSAMIDKQLNLQWVKDAYLTNTQIRNISSSSQGLYIQNTPHIAITNGLSIDGKTHGIRCDRGPCTVEVVSGILSGSNYQSGIYADELFFLKFPSGSTPTITGTTKGDITLYNTAEDADWATIGGGTPFVHTGLNVTIYRDGDTVPTSGGGADADAIHDNVAGEIAAVTEKATPVSADLLLIEDSADSNNKKRVQVGNLSGGSAVTKTTGEGHVYVDFDTGDDEKSGADWANAKATLAAAVAAIAEVANHNIVVHCRGTSSENVTINVPIAGQDKNVVFDGFDNANNKSVIEAETASTSVTATTLTKTGAGWTVNAYRGAWVRITDGAEAGSIRQIEANTADTLTFCFQIPGFSGTPNFEIIRSSCQLNGAVTFYNRGHATCVVQGFDSDGTGSIEVYGGGYYRTIGLTLRSGAWSYFDGVDVIQDGAYINPDTLADNSQIRIGVHCDDSVFYFYNSSSVIYYYGITGKGVEIDGVDWLYFVKACVTKGITCYRVRFARIVDLVVTGEVTAGAGIAFYDGGKLQLDSTDVSNKDEHAMVVRDASLYLNDDGGITGSGNTGAGLFADHGSRVTLHDSLTPTITGTVGDVSLDGTTQKSTWAAIAGGTPVTSGEGTYVKRNQDHPAGGGADADAIHDNVAGEISAITEKASPVGADVLLIEDSADSNNKKKVQITNLPGGGSSPLTTKGDLFGYDTADARIPVGTDGQVLTADSAETLGVKWATPSGGGFSGYEDVFTATSTGQQTFTLSTNAATNANFPAGYSILGVYVNGLKQKFSTDPGTREYDMGSTPAANTVRVGGLNIDDEIEIVYGA